MDGQTTYDRSQNSGLNYEWRKNIVSKQRSKAKLSTTAGGRAYDRKSHTFGEQQQHSADLSPSENLDDTDQTQHLSASHKNMPWGRRCESNCLPVRRPSRCHPAVCLVKEIHEWGVSESLLCWAFGCDQMVLVMGNNGLLLSSGSTRTLMSGSCL